MVTGGVRLFAGEFTDVDRRLIGGFARVLVGFAGTGSHEDQTLPINFQNENLIAGDGDGAVLAVVPDLICIVASKTAKPITTVVLSYGPGGEVIAVPAYALLKTPEALAVAGPAAFGYPG